MREEKGNLAMAVAVAGRCYRRRRPRVEELEPRLVLSGFQPTAMEQLFLEDLNAARSNPTAYGQSIGVDLSYIAPSEPLAFSPQLVEAARLHSQDMNDRAYFAHDTPEGVTPGQRVAQAGYPGTFAGESIAAGTNFDPASALAALITDSGVPSLGHRNHLLSAQPYFQAQSQVGVGIVLGGSGPYTNYYTIDTGFPADTRPLITGVVFHDDNGNGKHDAGEGFSGVAVTVQGAGSTLTFDSGGYSVPVSPGTYTVTASGGGLAAPITQMVTVGSINVRLDFLGTAEGSWNTLASLPAARSALAVVVGQDGRIYALGGVDTNSQPVGTLTAYSTSANTWTPLRDMPTPRDSLAATVGQDGQIYAFGGQDAGRNPLTTAEAYNPSTNTWSTLASMPDARASEAAVTGPDGRIYVLGGASGRANFPSTVDVYTPATNTWSTAAAMPTPRAGLAAVVGLDGRIYALGGSDIHAQDLGTVEIYDPSTNTWTSGASMPDPRAFFAAVTGADGRIYVLGGGSANGTLGAAVEVYTPASNTWSTLANLPTPRSDLGAALGPDGRIYTVGGYTNAVIGTVEALTVPVELGFAAAAFSVAEGTASATITVVRTGSASGAVTAQYAVSPGTATAGVDYTPVSGTLSFASGQTFQQFTVPLLDDGGTGEPDETIALTLSNPTGGATLANPASAALILVENDPVPITPGGPGSGQPSGPGSGSGATLPRVTDISTLVRVSRVKSKHASGSRVLLKLQNVAGIALPGPVSLVLSGMPHKMKLRTRTGFTQVFGPAGRPYLNVVRPGGVFPAGATLTVTLVFSGAGGVRPKFTAQVLAGPGRR
jgi:N-acetylneuraminic acid mutarotase